MYNICISIICVQIVYEAQATLLRRRKQVTMFGHTDYSSKRRITKEKGAGLYSRSKVYKETCKENTYWTLSLTVFTVTVFITRTKHFLSSEVLKPPTPIAGIKCIVFAAHCGIKPLYCQRTLTLDQVFRCLWVWAPAEAPFVGEKILQKRGGT